MYQSRHWKSSRRRSIRTATSSRKAKQWQFWYVGLATTAIIFDMQKNGFGFKRNRFGHFLPPLLTYVTAEDSPHQLRAAGGPNNNNNNNDHQQQRLNRKTIRESSSNNEDGNGNDMYQDDSPGYGTPHMMESSTGGSTDEESDGTKVESVHDVDDSGDITGSTSPMMSEQRAYQDPTSTQWQAQKQNHDRFFQWCHEALGISADLVEIDYFPYYDYLSAMEDKIDIFCEDCYSTTSSSSSFGSIIDELLSDLQDGQERMGYDVHSSSNSNPRATTTMTDDYFTLYDEDIVASVTDYEMIFIRGLKAAQNIHVGQVLIQVPSSSLWTLENVVDSDPILSPVMGLQSRKDHGWDSPVDEIPLLSVALLYHFQQGSSSPYWPYLQQLLVGQHGTVMSIDDAMQSLQKSIPHLWSPKKLRKSATQAVRSVSKGIQRDVMEMYETIVMVLIEDYPELFGDRNAFDDDEIQNVVTESDTGHDDNFLDRIQRTSTDDGSVSEKNTVSDEDGLSSSSSSSSAPPHGGWMFSLEKFHWAFAIVNSRHWHLPIPSDPLDVNTHMNDSIDTSEDDADAIHEEDDHVSFSDQEGPPASTPTDEWLDYQRELQRKEEEEELKQANSNDADKKMQDSLDGQNEGMDRSVDEFWPDGDSFLAPLADLLNFGPPCTRGIYNKTTDAFEIIATCPFVKGQEITFYYTDACEDVFVSNYGFTEPFLVPKCADPATERIQHLEELLFGAFQDLDMLDSEVDHLLEIIHDCHCENQTVHMRPDYLANGGKNLGAPPKAPSPPSSPGRQHKSPDGQRDRQRRRSMKGRNQDRRNAEDNSNIAKHAIRGRNRRGGSSKSRMKHQQRDALERNGSNVFSNEVDRTMGDNQDGYQRNKSEF